jgi:ribosome biogenesis protein Nip4
MPESNRRGRKPKNEPYFGVDQEEAVKSFLSLGILVEDNTALSGYRWSGTTRQAYERDKIYREKLRDPLNKMVESIIRKYKLYSKNVEFEETHADALSFLMIKFHKFKPDKNKKSYSYYGTVCKHYLLGKLIKEDKKMKSLLPYEDYSSTIEEDEKNSYVIDDYETDLSEFISNISKEIKEEMESKIMTENEEKVGISLVRILDEWPILFSGEIGTNKKYNKNLFLLYMRNMTSLNTKDIRNSMKRFRSVYKILKDSL